MTDTDEGTRRIHCNSNKIGFLNSSNGWGSYCSDNGDWTTDFISYAGASMRTPIFYDKDNTGYYTNPASNSHLNTLTTAGTITAAGDITAFSDERLKDNIETITSPLDKVKALRGVTFDKDGKRGLGVIAQEIEAVIPEVVHTSGDEMGTKSVAYGNIVGLLIEAIKELKSEVDDLKKQLKNI
jgi:hypothetical protein